jgi:hypothetical protein
MDHHLAPLQINGQKLTLTCQAIAPGTRCATCPAELEAAAKAPGMTLERDGRLCPACAEARVPGFGLLFLGLHHVALALTQLALTLDEPDTVRAMSTQAARYALELGDRFANFGSIER